MLRGTSEKLHSASRNAATLLFVVCIHIIFLYFIEDGLTHTVNRVFGKSIEARIIFTEQSEKPRFILPNTAVNFPVVTPIKEPTLEFQKETSKPGVVYEKPPTLAHKDTTILPHRDPASPPRNIDEFYPESALRERQEGSATLWVFIDAAGDVVKTRIEKSTGHEALDQSAINYVKTWKFVPGKRDGAIAPMWTKVLVLFSLPKANTIPSLQTDRETVEVQTGLK